MATALTGAAWLALATHIVAAMQFTAVRIFTPTLGTPDGYAPSGPMVQASDGWIYGLTTRHGTDTSGSGSQHGAVFRFDPTNAAGTYQIVFDLGSFAAQHVGVFNGTAVADGGLVTALDGNLYFTTIGDCGSGVFQVVPSGVVTLLHNFGCQVPQQLIAVAAGLTVGPDGALYTVAVNTDTPTVVGGVVRVALDGTTTKVADLPASFNLTQNQTGFTALTTGSDGWLYGSRTNAAGSTSADSRLFRVNPVSGLVEPLYDFPLTGTNGEDHPAGNQPIGRLLEVPAGAADIAFLGVTAAGGTAAGRLQQIGDGTIFRVELTSGTPTVSVVYGFTPAGPFEGVNPRAGLTRAPDGTIYGTTFDSVAKGTVFRLGTNNQPVLLAGPGLGLEPWAPILVAIDGDLYGSSFADDANLVQPALGRIFRLEKAVQAALTVTGAPTSATYGATFVVGTSGGTGTGAVTYAASGACANNGGPTITMTSGTGICSVTATKAGDLDYKPINSAPVTVTAAKANQGPIAVTGAPATAPFGSNFIVGAIGGLGTGAVAFSATGACSNTAGGAQVTMTSGSGSCSIVATRVADSDYNGAVSPAATVTATLATQPPLSIVGAPASIANGNTFSVGVSGGSGAGAMTFTTSGACSNVGPAITMVQDTGTCSITATKAADGNYAAATSPAVVVAAIPLPRFQFGIVKVFTPTLGTPDGYAPSGPMVQASDGWIYGLTTRHGTDTGGSGSQHGALFRFDPTNAAGTYQIVFDLGSFAAQHVGVFSGTEIADGGLIAAPDGNLYFSTVGGCGSGVFRVVPSGSVTLLHSFGCGPTLLHAVMNGLTVGLDGALYTVAVNADAATVVGGVMRVALDGTTTKVADLPANFNLTQNQTAFSALTAGSDGWLYGSRTNLGSGGAFGNDDSKLFRVHPATGVVETLYDFPLIGPTGEDHPEGSRPIGRWLEVPAGASDIAFLGVTAAGGTSAGRLQPIGDGTIFRVELTSGTPTVSVVYGFTPAGPFIGVNPRAGLTRAADGTIYGTTFDSVGKGTVFRLGPNGQPVMLAGPGLGIEPWAPLLIASDGDLYGSSFADDGNLAQPALGRIFRLIRSQGGNVFANGSFTNGLGTWVPFATPGPAFIVTNVVGGVLEFYRVPPPAGQSNQAVVLQNTGLPVDANEGLAASFAIGNSSTVRKRITVLMHDGDFSDLTVCTFWLGPNTPLATYGMRTHTTKAWTNASLSFYAATPGFDGGYYRIDNVVVQYAPTQPPDHTECIDPTVPTPTGAADGPEMLVNGTFNTGTTAGWSTFGQLNAQVTGGVFEFYRPSAQPDPAGVILQPTGQGSAAGEVLTLQIDLGNTSTVRKRVTVLLHDLDFSDLTACTFWIEPGQALATYAMRSFATKTWVNTTVSIYAATIGDETWTQLDNVSLRKTPAAAVSGTDCAEPGSSLSTSQKSESRSLRLTSDGSHQTVGVTLPAVPTPLPPSRAWRPRRR